MVSLASLSSVRTRLKRTVYNLMPASRVVRRGPSGVRRVAITFDDGPDHMTDEYLTVLDRIGVPATFFLVGEHCAQRPALVNEYVRRGHQIAAHGYDHTRFPDLATRALREQLARTDDVLGPQPTQRPWIRPPYGAMSARVMGTMLAGGYFIALWSLDSLDYATKDVDQLVARCAPDKVSPGEILLFHEGQRWTLDAIPRIVDALRADGYDCVTMADLLVD
jgi:peptidoglycan/xylan/chitin deacetylase (PgdA/CDA1 family)